ncbi:uncharacterized protein LOC121369705 isoform X2 [Gigantopelta aegis]|uniref:uncharacterized protein LOC121369705 isoform X1 n=1 Tax=Gigantopelta aegis TaxID=1735272 RepID=UPI001B88B085|nr:uncharacterized protein LOC121369705 isoform X1 [Gigantopelta aegis]XP_041350702.1 uncharacterized protein LOC121369705 isoform X2 [Gigantopelta aegis]
MDESEVKLSRTHVIRRLAIFCLWTVTSFVCHQCAKVFLRTGLTYLPQHSIFLSVILTLAQAATCVSLVDVQQRRNKLFCVIALSHVIATFCTNCSMALMSASSTLAIKLMEPITSAVLQRLVLSVPLSTSTLVSLPLIVSGSVIFAGNPLAVSSISAGVLLAVASNVILAIRNVSMKLGQKECGSEIRLRPAGQVLGVAGCVVAFTAAVYVLELRGSLPKFTTPIIAMLLTSSLFHVVYSYVSTNVVLRYMTVVSHAVSNIMKRVVVVLLLYLFGQRHAATWNFAGLIVCTLGLMIYVKGKIASDMKMHNKAVTDSSKSLNYRKALGLLIISAVSVLGVVGNFGSPRGSFSSPRGSFRRLENHHFDHHPPYTADKFRDRSFGADAFKLMDKQQLLPDLNSSYLAQNKSQINQFLTWRLMDHGHNTDLLAPLLPTSYEIIREAQRVHFNLLADLIGQYKYAMFFDIAAFENKGDPAITTGEVYLLRRLGIKVVFYCSCLECADTKLQIHAQNLSKGYSNKELVILFHGGGNLIGYPFNDVLRENLFPRFKGFQIVVFPQTVFVRDNKYSGAHFTRCKKIYCCNPNLTIVLRDRTSLEVALKYWNNGTKFLLAPDMAFQIGPVRRFMSPVYDILWLKRKDSEAPSYLAGGMVFPKNVTYNISDWWAWTTPKGSSSMETAFLVMNNGLVFLQRGRVVVTDRLHGHILCMLLNIPHVLIDNKYKKLSSYHNTWTRGLDNAFITNKSSQALKLALILLDKYKDQLPPIAPIMDVNEYKVSKNREKAEKG